MKMSTASYPVVGRITPETESDGTLRYDRRGADRQPLEGRATAFESGGDGFGQEIHDLLGSRRGGTDLANHHTGCGVRHHGGHLARRARRI